MVASIEHHGFCTNPRFGYYCGSNLYFHLSYVWPCSDCATHNCAQREDWEAPLVGACFGFDSNSRRRSCVTPSVADQRGRTSLLLRSGIGAIRSWIIQSLSLEAMRLIVRRFPQRDKTPAVFTCRGAMFCEYLFVACGRLGKQRRVAGTGRARRSARAAGTQLGTKRRARSDAPYLVC